MRMPPQQFDTLIVGQGLAGSALAWHLIHAGQRVGVFDDGHKSASSAVAAGLVNPLAGMRFNRRPELNDWLAAADRWYATLAVAFGRPLFHHLPMLRLFRSLQQQRFHARRRQDPASRPLLDDGFSAEDCPEDISAPYGGFIQHRTGYVDMPLLLDVLRDWLQRRGALVEGEVDPARIGLHGGGVDANGLCATRLVFCDGARLRTNPWFSGLPLQPDKGEILDLEAGEWRPRHIINGAHWLLPMDNGEIRLGATHEHHEIDCLPTAAGKRQLLAGLLALRPRAAAPRVVRHQAGIRPASADRYPLIGRHRDHAPLWVFNGFGARGALTIPWYAERLSAHLQSASALPSEVDIRRFG
jgi:glycine/D-amino acid oxidase-like deaminating enzyme